jgi:hypothetical protein
LASVALHFGDRALTAAHYVLAAAQIRFDLDVADRKAVDRKFFRRLQSHRVVLAQHVLVPQKIPQVRCQAHPPSLIQRPSTRTTVVDRCLSFKRQLNIATPVYREILSLRAGFYLTGTFPF